MQARALRQHLKARAEIDAATVRGAFRRTFAQSQRHLRSTWELRRCECRTIEGILASQHAAILMTIRQRGVAELILNARAPICTDVYALLQTEDSAQLHCPLHTS
jgi:hypothetical protein